MSNKLLGLLNSHLAVVAAMATAILGIAGGAVLNVSPPLDAQWQAVPLLFAHLAILLFLAADSTLLSPRTSDKAAGRIRMVAGSAALIGFAVAMVEYDAQFSLLVLKCDGEEQAFIVPLSSSSEASQPSLLVDRCRELGDAGWVVERIRTVEAIAQARTGLLWRYSLALSFLCLTVQGLVGALRPRK